MDFDAKLQQILFEHADTYISPEDLYVGGDNLVTFIYNQDGTIYHARGRVSHVDLVSENAEYYGWPANKDRKDYDNYEEFTEWVYLKVDKLTASVLQGRIGDMKTQVGSSGLGVTEHVLSFWNDKKQVYGKLLEPCINELKQLKLVDNGTFISTPLYGKQPLNKNFKTKTQTEPVVDADKLNLLRQLHLMLAAQKKAALYQLGYRFNKPRPDSLIPGQKFWALNSEGTTYGR